MSCVVIRCELSDMNSQLKQHVRILYKAILKLHRGLPPELRALGDGYLKQEFQKHKHARQHEVGVFMHEWTVSGCFYA